MASFSPFGGLGGGMSRGGGSFWDQMMRKRQSQQGGGGQGPGAGPLGIPAQRQQAPGAGPLGIPRQAPRAPSAGLLGGQAPPPGLASAGMGAPGGMRGMSPRPGGLLGGARPGPSQGGGILGGGMQGAAGMAPPRQMPMRPQPGLMGQGLGGAAMLSDEASKQEIEQLTSERDRFKAMSQGMQTQEDRDEERRKHMGQGLLMQGLGSLGGRR